ncbi:hypothetical protein M569_15163 [Genlisea aurea]|uniref:Uncharacterized protein n=1 Tax=Genlisea aurea TaxID=192259 RepID=S8DJG9_9LAMI|nr:hypothetical protein M569_15163 [Genlisea aurea]
MEDYSHGRNEDFPTLRNHANNSSLVSVFSKLRAGEEEEEEEEPILRTDEIIDLDQ